MNKIDIKILTELIKNSRTPITSLAKKIGVSREVATYRINKLKEGRVIIDFITEINIKKLGYVGAALFINVKTHIEKEFKEFLKKSKYVSWVAELSGVWSFGLSIVAKTNNELNDKFFILYNKFKDDIIDHRFTLHKQSYFFYEKYFNEISPARKEKNKKRILDNIDKTILKELATNARIDCVELSKKVPISSQAVRQRIKELEVSRYIEKYSIFVDVSKLGLFQYSIFITNKKISDRKKLLTYLSQHLKVSFIAEYLGDPFLEFGLFVKDPYELRHILHEIEESFPDNRLIEISLFHKEFVSIGPPTCVFE